MRKYHDVSSYQLDSVGTILDLAASAPIGEQVINDDVFGSLAKNRRDFARRRRTKPPRRREFGVEEDRAFELHRIEDFRESVHRGFDADSWLKVSDSRVNDQHATTSQPSLADARISMPGGDRS